MLGKPLEWGPLITINPTKTPYISWKKIPFTKRAPFTPRIFPTKFSMEKTIHLWEKTIHRTSKSLVFGRLQAIPAARTGKKLIIKLPKVATSENRQPWHFCHEELLVESFRRGEKTQSDFQTHEAYGFQNESDIPKAGWGKKLPMILT